MGSEFTVDARVHIPRVLIDDVRARFNDIYEQVSTAPLSSLTLRALPAITIDTEQSPPLMTMRWVEISAGDALHASVQIAEVIRELCRLLYLPAIDHVIMTAYSGDESSER